MRLCLFLAAAVTLAASTAFAVAAPTEEGLVFGQTPTYKAPKAVEVVGYRLVAGNAISADDQSVGFGYATGARVPVDGVCPVNIRSIGKPDERVDIAVGRRVYREVDEQLTLMIVCTKDGPKGRYFGVRGG